MAALTVAVGKVVWQYSAAKPFARPLARCYGMKVETLASNTESEKSSPDGEVRVDASCLGLVLHTLSPVLSCHGDHLQVGTLKGEGGYSDMVELPWATLMA